MSKVAFAALAFVAACSGANAAVIDTVISPTQFVVADGGKRSVIELPGSPVYACGLKPFLEWANRLQGQTIEPGRDGFASVTIDGTPQSVEGLLVRSGWLRPAVLDDDAQAALTERRGGWACASAQAPFDAMRTSVDARILTGIALNESAYNGRAWPWTLNVAGRGFFFRSRDDAYKAVRFLISDGRCDFDVGLMQINWCYHAKRFASPWDALAPATNIHVAEDILNENFRKTKSAVKAVAYYHSANPQPGREYLARFVQHLSQLERGL
ncbi:transglycosylase SLT domain protein [Paraburkholderia fungorum]|uniref:Transglycosylase SLT domain protein n=1 Tax=Paraburkholderia fungorum TaxID=134537 RepID=A0AAP5QF53_9BURK|nr:transglycosylase SLT domain-containing protein [Paraburkholderia fungorum]AJZ57070.1 transglycosylase SLT domain protein [Paraburkholderia fungorum]MDT8842530.1 transglycosylase SLT domain-containing protein [Paraburkholderia fungorum]